MRGGVHTRAFGVLSTLVVAGMLSAMSPSIAEAGFWCWLVGCGDDSGTATRQTSPQVGAPEIDSGALANAIALAAGGAALLGGRVRRRR